MPLALDDGRFQGKGGRPQLDRRWQIGQHLLGQQAGEVGLDGGEANPVPFPLPHPRLHQVGPLPTEQGGYGEGLSPSGGVQFLGQGRIRPPDQAQEEGIAGSAQVGALLRRVGGGEGDDGGEERVSHLFFAYFNLDPAETFGLVPAQQTDGF